MRPAPPAAAAAAALLLAAAAGCQGPPRPAGLDVLEELPPGAPLTAADLLPLRERTWRCALGDEAEPSVVMSMARTDVYRAQWVLEEAGRRAEYLAVGEGGDVVMTAVAEYGEGALTVFKPPLLIAPAVLEAGASRRAECQMRVVELDDVSRHREGGTATRTITYEADQRLRTPLGEFVARRIQIEFTADLSLADVRDTATLYLVSGLGVVAEISRQEIRVLGVLPNVRERVLLLSDEGH
jgi:hypothetical protein